MAAKAVKLKDVEQELKDMTECCICLKSFDDPRMLPCIHTFCLKCLSETAAKLEKCVGDKLPCPLCRKEFVIPPDGVSALQKNFFIDKLAGMKKMLSSSMRVVPCDGCLEDEVLDAPSAEVFCEDCSQHLCSSCLKQHMKFKATRNHTVVNVNLTEAEDLSKSSSATFCGKHRNQELAIFCFDCRLVLCRLCFRESHSLHKGSSIAREADKFREEISNSAKDLSACFDRFQSQRDQLKKETTDFLQTLQHVESEIVQTAEDVKELVDGDMKSLLAELKSIKDKREKEALAVDDELDLQLTILETHSHYCKYIAEKGSPADICQAAYDLKGKTDEMKLLGLNPSPKDFKHLHLKVSFMKSALKDFIGNTVGKITENIGSSENLKQEFHPEQTSRKCIDSYVSSANIVLKATSNSENPSSALISNTDIDTFFSMEENSSSVYNKTRKETKGTTPVVLFDMGGDPVQQNLVLHQKEPLKYKSEGCDLQLSYEDVTTKWKGRKCQVKPTSRKALNSFSTVTETAMHIPEDDEDEDCISDIATIGTATMNTSYFPVAEPLFKSTETIIVTNSERMDPVLLRTIQTKECRGITGFAILCEKIYVVSKDSSEVEVFDLIDSEFICRWKLNRLEAPGDLTSCSKFMCIYIMDAKHVGDSSEILKVDVNGKIIHRWYVQDNYGCMSVTSDASIIVAAYETHRIYEFSPDGTLLRQLYLPFCGIYHPLHVLKLTESRLLIGYGSVSDPEHGVCVIHADSDTTNPFIIRTFGGRAGYSNYEIDVPIFLALDSVGDILVTDCENSRVLLLSSGLQFKTQHLSYADGLRHPYRLHVDDMSNRLVVSDNDSYMEDGRIQVFEIRRLIRDPPPLPESESFNSESEDDFSFYAT